MKRTVLLVVVVLALTGGGIAGWGQLPPASREAVVKASFGLIYAAAATGVVLALRGAQESERQAP